MSDINTGKEYDFPEAWRNLLKGKVITSIKTKYSYGYSFNTGEKEFKLRVYIPVASLWQDAEYVLAKEMFEKWYITDIGQIYKRRIWNG